MLAWATLAAVHAGVIALSADPPPLGTRVAHHLFDAGATLAIGIAVQTGTDAWRRLERPSRWPWGYLVIAVVAIVAAMLTLPQDLYGVVEAAGIEPSDDRVRGASALAALAIPAAAAVGARAGRSRLRWIAVAVGVAIMVANNAVLDGDYRGIHLLATLVAVTLVGASLDALDWPGHALLTRLRGPRSDATFYAALCLFASAAVVLPPSQQVRLQLSRVDGSAASAIHRLIDRDRAVASASDESEWYRPRDHVEDVPPTTPPLVGPDTIVIFLTMDAVRAEILLDDEHAEHVRALREIANESVVFRNARSVGSGTIVTFASVFTGKHRFQLRWKREKKDFTGDKSRLLIRRDPSVRFTELLQGAGVTTVTFSAFGPLHPRAEILRGFDEATQVEEPNQPFALSGAMTKAIAPRLESQGPGPMFLFAHFMDPHSPYDSAGVTHPPFKAYLHEIQAVSDAIGGLVDTLKKAGLWDRTVLVIGADHGEGFNKHKGVAYHNIALYEEILHVPLIVRVPGVAPRIVDAPVSLIDVGPTVLDLYGLPTPGSYMGQSLLPYLRGQNPVLTRPIAASSVTGATALYRFPFKVIDDKEKGTLEVYDLEKDPDERSNLADTQGAELQGLLRALMAVHAPR